VTQQLQIEGPKSLLSAATTCTSLCQFGQSGLLSRIPLFAATAAAADPWSLGYQWAPAPGGPPLGPFTSVTGCDTIRHPATGASLCDTNALGDGRRFWGFFTVIIVWAQLLQLAGVDALGADYKWSIARSAESSNGTGVFPWVIVSSSDGALPTRAYDAGRVSDAVRAYSSAWVLTVEPRASWEPAWRGGALAGVVLLAALLTALVIYIVLQQRVNDSLLYSMLPRRVVAKMRAGETDIAEPFEHITLLFTDIVRFTDLVAAISPHETLQMLNQLFTEFDEIAQRHGVLKLETVGDAFVAVAGIAGERDPGEQALRMARCALDMADCAARHELPTGGNMLIRVGLHCGPAVAGVVGQALPHYSVFGDVVNTCARIESTSLPGRIQVSARFHAVLAAAVEAQGAAAAAAAAGAGVPQQPPQPPPFFLHPRGVIALKGKGVMQTHFLLRAGDCMSEDELLGPSSPERSFVRSVTAGSGAGSSGGDAAEK
jgi:class 3 adenylate cyclase